jgi:hypothetical protein
MCSVVAAEAEEAVASGFGGMIEVVDAVVVVGDVDMGNVV